MTASLSITLRDTTVDLFAGTPISTGPAAGATLHLADGASFGHADPALTTMDGYFDGNLITGARAANRNLSLPIIVVATDPLVLAAAVSLLASVVDQQTWQLTWCPDGGLPVVFDAYRGSCVALTGTSEGDDLDSDAQGVRVVQLSCQARPFGRSPEMVTTPATGTQRQLQSFDTAQTGATLDTSVSYEGTGSNKLVMNVTTAIAQGTIYSKTVGPWTHAAFDLSDKVSVQVWARYQQALASDQPLTARLILTASGVNHIYTVTRGFGVNWLGFANFIFDISADAAAGLLTSVTGEQISFSTLYPDSHVAAANLTVNIDDLRALPGWATTFATTAGAIYTVAGVVGDARAPISIELDGTAMNAALVHALPQSEDPLPQILIGLNPAATGSHSYSVVPPCDYQGTFDVVLVVNAWDTSPGANPRTVTVTVTESVGGAAVGTPVAVSRSIDPNGSDLVSQLANRRLAFVGQIELPIVPSAEPTQRGYTFTVASSGAADTFADLLLLDVTAPTLALGLTPGAPAVQRIYLDAPDPGNTVGDVLVSTGTSRQLAYSALGTAAMDNMPFFVEPGVNHFLIVSPEGAPSAAVSHMPRWRMGRWA